MEAGGGAWPTKQIADQLDISVRTVRDTPARVFDKMNVRSAVGLLPTCCAAPRWAERVLGEPGRFRPQCLHGPGRAT